ncbi:MAG: error-prone DNA polymerase [Candidatus Rokuibacteriota bacterium]|nr:MAG: error-prone DNA polymerase [Candidatus Rokubacteria bacterium]PYM53427.1 MAG: error-prone DNA polymerase [Candidatus Rokubacteria bacterium]
MFVELHAKSAFSFLEATALPEALAGRAVALEQPALALVDTDGVYGAPAFYRACTRLGITPLVGAEVSLMDGGRLPLLVEDQEGYKNLCRLLTRVKMRAAKCEGAAGWDDLEEHVGGLVCLTGGASGPVAAALAHGGHEAARATLDRLAGLFGRFGVYAELQRDLSREQEARNEWLRAEAERLGLPLLASNAPLMIARGDRPLLDTLTCIKHGTTIDRAGRLLARNSERFLKPGREMERLFADCPSAVANTGELALRLGFTLKHLGYRFPDYPLPTGQTPIGWLRALCKEGARQRYGAGPLAQKARRQIERELDLIARLDLSGYFLIVWDLVEFCRRHGILVQGRGSAANSAVCYALGITAVDPVGMELLFERFLSEERGEWPDIDLDLPSGDRREQVIQYVYERYGRLGAAMTANVITYRGRSAAREVGKVLGLPPALCDRLSALVSNWEYKDPGDSLLAHLREAGCDPAQPVMRHFADLWTAIQDLPRHLGQHSGGMVICQGRLDSCVPLEPATMPGRSVVQWDKDDCASMGIIKVDLLGLGMMALLEDAIGMIRRRGGHVDLAHLPPDDPTVYAMLQKADTVGVFQVESRAQMATLPRLKPKCFYDLVVQVAIIRPGPIVGDMVHPYLRRRAGREPVTVPHPNLEPILRRTLGVPLFQEQLLRMAMATAGFTGGEAEELRRAFGFKRRKQAMDEVEKKLRAGMAEQGISGEAAEAIIRSITAFALYGFPESHAASFALLAYASTYLKAHHPAAFYAALLNNQPMGFYHPATIVGDAARHGQTIHPADVNHSDWLCAIEADGTVRLGLRYVRGLREEAGRRIERLRPFASADDLVRRAGLHHDELTRLAELGALGSLGLERRAALWEIELAARPAGALYEGIPGPPSPSPLPSMTAEEALVADCEGTGLTLGPHPMVFHRERLERLRVARAIELPGLKDGRAVRVAGAVVVRQRPGTAKGFVFLNLEDETGLVNVVVPPPLFHRYRLVLVQEPFLYVEGTLEHRDDVISVRAGRIQPLRSELGRLPSHDFH